MEQFIYIYACTSTARTTSIFFRKLCAHDATYMSDTQPGCNEVTANEGLGETWQHPAHLFSEQLRLDVVANSADDSGDDTGDESTWVGDKEKKRIWTIKDKLRIMMADLTIKSNGEST